MKHYLNDGATPSEGDICIVKTLEGKLLICEYIVKGRIENNFFSTETGKQQNVETWEIYKG